MLKPVLVLVIPIKPSDSLLLRISDSLLHPTNNKRIRIIKNKISSFRIPEWLQNKYNLKVKKEGCEAAKINFNKQTEF